MENDPLSQWVMLSQLNITYLNLSSSAIWQFSVLPVLLLLLALVAASEAAFFALTAEQANGLKIKNRKIHFFFEKLIEKKSVFHIVVQLSVWLISIAITVVTYVLLKNYWGFSGVWGSQLVLMALLVSFFLLVFGHLVPRNYAVKHPVATVRVMTYPMWLLHTLFYPLTYILASITSFLGSRFHKNQHISKDDISEALELNGESIPEDKEILKGIIEFGSIEVSEIMCPRVDVQAFEIHETYPEILNKIVESGYSRIPVYQDSFDNVKGILYIKDLLPYFGGNADFNWQSLLRPPYYVPERKKIDELLEELQKNKIHMAIVVDEYGGTSGIVTMEDILEEIIGDIADEFDSDESNFTEMSDGSYLFDGKVTINDVCKELEISHSFFDEIRGDADTLAGLMLEIKGGFPILNDVIDYKQFTFTIVEFDKRRIKKIKVDIKV